MTWTHLAVYLLGVFTPLALVVLSVLIVEEPDPFEEEDDR